VSPPTELRHILEAAGLISGIHEPTKITAQPTPASRPPVTAPQPQQRSLFAWLHLSDIHFGHPNAGHQWDQALVLDALRRDIADHNFRGIPTPNAILVTGDIAFSGTAPQYSDASKWLLDLATLLNLTASQIFLVPGNHDVDRTVDKTNRNASRLLRALRDRDGGDDLDEALNNPDDRSLLTLRLAPYLSFAATFPNLAHPDPLFWSHPILTPSGLRLRLIGLNTALLAADKDDKERLRLGKQPLAQTLINLPQNELVLLLTHHPFRDNWLADQREADAYAKGRAHVHLSGHVHEADSEDARSGAGSSLLRIAAGAVHGDKLPPGVPASHGYSFAAVVPSDDGTLRLRVWPRRWSEKKKAFTQDTDGTLEGRPYAEHVLPGMHAPVPVPGTHGPD
jgi:calcineurin-like phosphoesterase family protein